jgi:hypothetical protein
MNYYFIKEGETTKIGGDVTVEGTILKMLCKDTQIEV